MSVQSIIGRLLVSERIPWYAVRLYDSIAARAVESYYRPFAARVVACTDRGRILDVGTGPGYLPVEIALVAPDLSIDAIDLTRRMVRIARAHAEAAGVADRIAFEVGNGKRLPYADNLFDMVISTGALHSWKDPVQVMRECVRVLKPGREAWICDPAQVVTDETRIC